MKTNKFFEYFLQFFNQKNIFIGRQEESKPSSNRLDIRKELLWFYYLNRLALQIIPHTKEKCMRASSKKKARFFLLKTSNHQQTWGFKIFEGEGQAKKTQFLGQCFQKVLENAFFWPFFFCFFKISCCEKNESSFLREIGKSIKSEKA